MSIDAIIPIVLGGGALLLALVAGAAGFVLAPRKQTKVVTPDAERLLEASKRILDRVAEDEARRVEKAVTDDEDPTGRITDLFR